MTKHRLNSRGFTLIELLIVIVIIGILAGVVIGVLNPIQQQNRARDATFRSSLNKMALAGKSLFVSSPRTTERAPSLAEFFSGVGGAADTINDVGDCASTVTNATTQCEFSVDGISLGADCASENWTGTGGAVQCEFKYYRTVDSFRIGVRGVANPPQSFVYEYAETGGVINEGFYTCPTTLAISGALGGCVELN